MNDFLRAVIKLYDTVSTLILVLEYTMTKKKKIYSIPLTRITPSLGASSS